MVGKSGQPFKKSRKYGESAEDLQDRLDFVAALLAWDDKEITIPPDSLKAQFELEWVKEDELRVSGILEQKQRNGQIKRIEKGITKKELGILLETYRQKPILEAARDELIQNALACLRDLGILKEHESAKNQGYWKFSLCLKHQTKREENLQVIRDKWKESFGELPEPNHPPQLTATLNRCILGLKGDYQQAQQQLTEITTTLQNLLKDKTLSITKVEEGSIILIVESSQTGYEQLKRLIGQEIAGFPVEYAIDEWQDICRRMLLDRKPLSSNTVIGQVYGNRNLIDEDLFVDLALVKPKRSENPKHPQEIDPEKGSDLYNREEVEKRFAYREFLEEVISQRTEKRLAIIGEPGAGKTTLLQKLAFWLLQATDDLVVWVSLAELGSQPLGEYLEQKWLTEALRQSREEIKADWGNKFEGGAVWLLLDGLDEMSQTDLQGLKFRGWVTDARMIVTCRLNLWQGNPSQLQGFQTYLTQPFQDEQMQEFIRRWFRGLVAAGEDVQLAESLWSELQESGKERIKDLCRNPLRLTLLCATWKVEDALPETMAELYGGFVESVYGWKETAFPVTEEEKEQLNAALGELAKASLEGETSRFRLTHRLVCEHLGKPKAKGSLFPLALKLGWLNEVGVAAENPREKVYGFYHATFQEYFAALAVEDWDYFLPKDHCDRPVEGKRYRIFEPQWKQVILLWLGREDIGDEEKEAFIRGLVEFEDGVRDFYEYQAFFLAAAGINEFKACSRAAEIVRQVVKWGFGYFNIEKQEWRTFLNPIEEGARKTIPETIRRLAVPELSVIIENCPGEDTRRQAAESLGAIDPGNADAIAALVKLIETTEDEDTQRQAAEILGEIGQGSPQAIAALVKLIETTKSDSTQCRAVWSLGKIDPGNPQAIAGLLEVIRNTENEFTRRQAARSLGEIGKGNPDAIAGLLKVIRNTEDEDTRREAIESLGEIGQGNPEAIAVLVEIIRNTEDEYTRLLAAWSLEEIDPGNPDAIAGLVEVIRNTEDEDTRLLAAEILGKIDPGNPDAIAVLVEVIRSTEDEDTRREAAQSLGEIDPGNPDAIAVLVEVIRNTEDEHTRRWAVESLEKIDPGNPDAIAILLEVIRNTEDELTRMAVYSLGEIGQGNPEAIAVLVEVIRNTKDEWTRRNAAYSLEEIDPGNPEAIAGLVEVIRNTEDELTRMAVYSLGEIGQGNPEAIAGLVELIRNTEDEYTRREAAESLWKIDPGNPDAIAGLLQVIRTTEDEDTRMQAAESLKKILTTRQHYAEVVFTLKDNLSDEVYQNNFKRFEASYKVIWNCAENLPYPEFYQAWHNPPTTPHPEVTEQTPHSGEPSFASPLTWESLQHLPLYCLNADLLADETREREIALTLSELIWEITCPDEDPPEPATPAELRRHLKTLKRRNLLPHGAILFGSETVSTPTQPTPELMAFCQKLTGVIAVAFLTEEPLEAPLKGFPPNQPNLISAIESWLGESVHRGSP
ncbi:HEAT repeat domain-containing protein [Limnospira fusiformis]|uniref:HEAT repeat domain-containing protein n=1 Tax=Limnospira fusiformis TaxID=54297 RepID=UPI001449A4D1|nr:NACHT domain-containing protein [Limnospira fusiformis SAG 85.79]